MVKLTIEVTGDAPRELGEVVKRAENLAPAFKNVGVYMLRSVEKNFQAGGRPQKWLPLSLTTLGLIARSVKRKAKGLTLGQTQHRRVASKKILIDKANLKNSISYQLFAGGGGVEIGTNLAYAAIHQFGGQAGRGRKVKIPARPYLVVQEEDLPRITQLIGGYTVKGSVSGGE